jgi:hypothetical protein
VGAPVRSAAAGTTVSALSVELVNALTATVVSIRTTTMPTTSDRLAT